MANRYIEEVESFDSLFDEEEMDEMKSVMALMLIENTELTEDFIYSIVFSGGQNIIWH